MDLEAVRTFVAAANLGQFQGAADDLQVTQQAVSKRASNPHPALTALREHVTATHPVSPPEDPSWLPPWTTADGWRCEDKRLSTPYQP